MGGKASILIVLGFSLIFAVAGTNFNRVASTSVDNVTDYFSQTTAFNIAQSAANMAANKIFNNPTWMAGFSNKEFSGGKMSATVELVDAFTDTRKITATGVYYDPVNKKDISKSIVIVLQPGRFSRFAYYSAYEPSGIWWTTNDVVWGPMHVQGALSVQGRPVFWGKVTTQSGINYYDPGKYVTKRVWNGRKWVYQSVWEPGSDDPQFLGGYESGVDLKMPDNGVSKLDTASLGGYKFNDKDTVYLLFQGDSIKIKYAKLGSYSSVFAKTFAPNGVIFASNSVLRLEGTVKGKYTVAVSGTSGKGKVFIDNDIVYNSDPRINSNSTDLLGIVAQNDVIITENAANNSDVNIHASIYSQNGGFGAENYNTRPVSGNINLLGGITQSTRRAVGTFSSSSGVTAGFSKNYRYDERLRIASPPFYPATGTFQVVSWYE